MAFSQMNLYHLVVTGDEESLQSLLKEMATLPFEQRRDMLLARDQDGNTLLHHAVRHLPCLELLLCQDVVPPFSCANDLGDSILHAAAQTGSKSTFKVLSRKAATSQLTQKNADGHTPEQLLDVARSDHKSVHLLPKRRKEAEKLETEIQETEQQLASLKSRLKDVRKQIKKAERCSKKTTLALPDKRPSSLLLRRRSRSGSGNKEINEKSPLLSPTRALHPGMLSCMSGDFKFTLVESPTVASAVISHMIDMPYVCVHGAGVFLGRNGPLTVLTLLPVCEKRQYPAMVVDVQSLRGSVFSDTPLKKLLESDTTTKIFLNGRNTAAALRHQFGVEMRKCSDLHSLFLAWTALQEDPTADRHALGVEEQQRAPTKAVLSKQFLSEEQCCDMQVHDIDLHILDPDVWRTRPLQTDTVQYASIQAHLLKALFQPLHAAVSAHDNLYALAEQHSRSLYAPQQQS